MSGAIRNPGEETSTRIDLEGRYRAPFSTPTGTVTRQLLIPDDPQFVAAVNELLSRLTFPEVWAESAGSITAQECAAIAAEMWGNFV